MSYHVISCHTTSYHTISYHIIPYHTISYHILSYHTLSYQAISRQIISYLTIPYHVMSCHIISCHIRSCNCMWCHVISCHTAPYNMIVALRFGVLNPKPRTSARSLVGFGEARAQTRCCSCRLDYVLLEDTDGGKKGIAWCSAASSAGRLRIHETPPNGVCNGDSTIMVIKAKQLPCVATHRACRNCQRTHRLS